MAEAEDSHPHLELTREEPITERRARPFGQARPEPENFRGHATRLRERLQEVRASLDEEVAGYDDRRLIKITLTEKVPADEVAHASKGIEIISQEDDALVLAFATDAQLDDFEMRLATLAGGERVTYQNLMHALEDLDRWTPKDRMGWALRQNGFPDEASFLLDVELWPLDRDVARARRTFENWLADNQGEQLDVVRKPYLTLYRVRCDASLAEALLRYRDVRTVDLPPDVRMDFSLLQADIEQFGEVPAPPDDAPSVVVLDTGLATGHPMLAPAVGDAETFLQGATSADEHGHGTMVAGIALYDDVAACIQTRSFVPMLRLFSGRVLDDRNEGDPRLIQNQVEEAVAYFVGEYGCRVFNLAYGDLNKPYQGRRLTGLAVTLDALAREYDVLFVVPTGNLRYDDVAQWHSAYPDYLQQQTAPLIDPAPALNVITVGGLARYDQSRQSTQNPRDPAYRSIAHTNQPSPFTRAGPSVGGATKPDLVDYGGNYSIDVRTRHLGHQGMGELSISREFAAGRPFAENSGTSFAAPHVTHTATMLMREFPDASSDLCRALLACHAEIPSACETLFPDEADALRNIVGYGRVNRSALYRSLDSCVTLWAEGTIQNRKHHFYEIPIPQEFWEGDRRDRKLTVALAYRPPVRTTRVDYRAVGITFSLVQAASMVEVATAFNAATDRDSHPSIRERASGRDVTARQRGRGTLQASTWTFKQPSSALRGKSWFVVVTRNDPAWGGNIAAEREPYALTVKLADRLAEEPRLYASIEARLRARSRARAEI